MGMGSNKKHISHGVVVWCVVLGLALLVVEAAAGMDPSTCSIECQDQPWEDYPRCMRECIRGAVLLAAHGHGDMGGEEASGGAVDALTAADALTIRCHCVRYGPDGGCQEWRCRPRRRAGGGGDGVGQLVEFQPGTAAYCRQFCEYAWDFATCNIECLGKKETRRVGGRQEEKKMKQEDLVLHLSDQAYCYDLCKDRKGEEEHHQCIMDCYGDLPEAAGLPAHGGAGGAVDATAADALTRCIRYCERRGADGRCQEWRCLRRHQAGWKSRETEEEEVEETRGGAVDALLQAFCVCQRRAADGHCEAWRCRRLHQAGLELTQTQEQLEETRGEAPSRGRCEAYCRNHYDASSQGYTHCMYMCPRLGAHGAAEGEEAAAGGRGAGQEDAPSA